MVSKDDISFFQIRMFHHTGFCNMDTSDSSNEDEKDQKKTVNEIPEMPEDMEVP